MASRRTGLWLLTTLLFFFLAFTAFVWGVNRLLLDSTPAFGSGSTLHVRLQGAIGEVAQQGPFVGPVTVREIDEALRRAADDQRIAAVLLEVGPVAGGYGKAQEIRAAVQSFQESGKPVVAFLEIGTSLDVYLASVADTVYQVPNGQIILGMMVQQPYYRSLFDWLGIDFQAFTSGDYKSAFNAYTETTAPAAEREMSESLLDDLYGQWIGDVAAGRDLDAAAVAAVFDEGLISARRARDAGLVDVLGYRDEVRQALDEAADGSSRLVPTRSYLRTTQAAGLAGFWGSNDGIALIHVNGLMVPGDFPDSLFGGNIAAGNTIARYIREARLDAAVKAIVLRVDSGGGAVTAAEVMGREIELAAQRKPVVVSMSDVAGSGGYWIAAKATRVLANRATYTGSIGVVSGRLGLKGTYDQLGINHDIIKRGDNADLLSPATTLRPEQAEILQRNVEETYAEFVEVVAAGRDMDVDAVDAVARGRVWTGQQAFENGLVDDIGGLRESLAAARAEAGIGPQSAMSVRVYPPRRTLFEEFSRLFTTAALAPAAVARLQAALAPAAVARLQAALAPAALARLQAPVPPALGDLWERLRMLRSAGPVWVLMDAALPTSPR